MKPFSISTRIGLVAVLVSVIGLMVAFGTLANTRTAQSTEPAIATTNTEQAEPAPTPTVTPTAIPEPEEATPIP